VDLMAKGLADAVEVEHSSTSEPVEKREGSYWAREPRSSFCSISSQWL
jgi:hypothetical protein